MIWFAVGVLAVVLGALLIYIALYLTFGIISLVFRIILGFFGIGDD